MEKSTVVNLYKNEYDVYIGRAGHERDGYFGNPYHELSRTENVQLYREHFHKRLKQDRGFAKRVEELRGKRLGCFCKPQPCHGDVIVEYVNNLPEVKPVRLAVIGSRTFNEYRFLEITLDWFSISKIISGGAKGADLLATKYAANRNIPTKVFPAEWDKYGKSAGYKRNVLIVEACDELVAFWDTKSRGTKHSLDIAKEQNKPVHIFKPIFWEEDKPFWEDDLEQWAKSIIKRKI